MTIGLELLPSHKLTPVTIKQCWRNFTNFWHGSSGFSEPLLKFPSETVAVDFDEDIDVQTERNKVLSGSVDNAILYLRNLQKVFFIFDFHEFYIYIMLKLFQCSIVILQRALPILGISWRKIWHESCCPFIDFLSSTRRMFWLFRNKWSWEDYNSLNVIWYAAMLDCDVMIACVRHLNALIYIFLHIL